MKKTFITVTIIVAVIFAGYKLVNRANNDMSQKTSAVRGEEGKRALEQKVLAFSIDGRTAKGVKRWHLEGDSAEIMEGEIHFNDLKAIAYNDDVIINFSSDTGIYYKDKGEVELFGNVRVVSDASVAPLTRGPGGKSSAPGKPGGFHLSAGSEFRPPDLSGGLHRMVLITEKAKWSQLTREISTESDIRIEHGKIVAMGKGGFADSDGKKAVLKKDVTVKIEPDTNVSCNGPLEVNYMDNTAVFLNNVKVKDKDGELFSDKLTVSFDSETKGIARVIAEGNVRLHRGNSYTMSEKAVYTESTKSAKLTGNPRIVIDPVELEGIIGGTTAPVESGAARGGPALGGSASGGNKH